MGIENITSKAISTVSELIDLHESLLESADDASPVAWAFRGQPRDFGTLVPSFQRQFSRQSFGTAEVIESRLMEAFREHYALLEDRSEDMPDPDRIGPGFDLRCLSVMQHYEIPTRLLDWTSNFWTAVYFACASDPGNQAELWYYDRALFYDQSVKDSSLHSFLDHSVNPSFEPVFLGRRDDSLLVELDPRITPRMKHQHAHHTVSTDVFADHVSQLFELRERYYPLESDSRFLGRAIIDPACKSKALRFLAEHKDITASTIFPDVVGLGRFLRWQFESLRTMFF